MELACSAGGAPISGLSDTAGAWHRTRLECQVFGLAVDPPHTAPRPRKAGQFRLQIGGIFSRIGQVVSSLGTSAGMFDPPPPPIFSLFFCKEQKRPPGFGGGLARSG